MLVVLALMAVLTATVSLSLRATVRAARVEDAAGQLASFDRAAREAARRLGRPLELRFDLNRGTVHRAGAREEPLPLRLPEGFRVAGLALPGPGGGGAAGAVGAGEVRVPVSVRGHTPSYAVRVASATGDELWLVVAGLTGKTLLLRNAADVEDIFATGAVPAEAPTPSPPAGGPDAD